MAPTVIVEYVFLDAQAYEAASFNFASKHFATLAKHLESGRLRLVITDITKREVHARIDRNLDKDFTALKNLQKNARVMRTSPLPEVTGAFTELDRDKMAMSISEAFDNFLRRPRLPAARYPSDDPFVNDTESPTSYVRDVAMQRVSHFFGAGRVVDSVRDTEG